MIVLRSTMDAAVEAERAKVAELARTYGEALRQTAALQAQLAEWITDKGEQLTPEQFAALFYSHDDRWQAAFFNGLQGYVRDYHAALPAPRHGEFRMGPGYPEGEAQWCWMAGHIDDSGFATLEAMFEHAKHARQTCAWCGQKPIRETLDGDALCQVCCDKWVKAQRPTAEELMDCYQYGSVPASADTHPKGGDTTQIVAPFMSGAVGEAETPKANPSTPAKGK